MSNYKSDAGVSRHNTFARKTIVTVDNTVLVQMVGRDPRRVAIWVGNGVNDSLIITPDVGNQDPAEIGLYVALQECPFLIHERDWGSAVTERWLFATQTGGQAVTIIEIIALRDEE